jgi:hypothetical protein
MLGKRFHHCCDNSQRKNIQNSELFMSPVRTKSKLDIFTPYIPKETVYSRATYNPNNKVTTEIKDRDAIIKALMKRLSVMSPKDSRVSILQEQINSIKREVEYLRNHRDKALKQRDDLLQYLTINTGKVVPIEAVKQVITSKFPQGKGLMTPIGSKEESFERLPEGQPVGKFSTGALGGDADIKQQLDEAPEGSMSTFGTQTAGAYTQDQAQQVAPQMAEMGTSSDLQTQEQGVGVSPQMAEMGTSSDLQTREQGVGAAPQMAEIGTSSDLQTREQGVGAAPQMAEMGTEPESENESEYEEPESESEYESGSSSSSEASERSRNDTIDGYTVEDDIHLYNILRNLEPWSDADRDAYLELLARRPWLDPVTAEQLREEQDREDQEEQSLMDKYINFDINKVTPSVMNKFLQMNNVTTDKVPRGPNYKKFLIKLIKDKDLEAELRNYVIKK